MNYVNEIIVWVYYIKEKYELMYGEVLPINMNIFAYTNDKKIAKMFEEQRKMKLFKKEKKELSLSEYNDFMRYMIDNHEDRYLSISTYNFYSKNGIKMAKDIAVTNTEKQRIAGRKMMLEVNITKYCWYNPRIFNDEIYKALKILRYNDISEFIGSYPNKILSIDKEDGVNTIEDIVKINDLELVIEVIGGTLAE